MSLLLIQMTRTGKPIWGIIVPLVIFIVSFVVTWMLYKHFSKRA